jgi:tetratricopeptide (TPR) repeat protein
VPYYVVGTPGGIYTYVPPIEYLGPGGVPYVPVPAVPVPVAVDRGTVAPPPPQGLIPPAAPKAPEKPAQRKDSARAAQLVTIGDRLFRGDNLKKAEERYRQAARFDPDAAAPRVRLAQVAFVREQYVEAAQHLREAETAEPGWILTAPDVQSMYGEPTDFARRVARLESHLHVHPDDRDAWLVLGAQWYLSGRTARAADVFERLNDPHRRPDTALAAFLRATNQPR